MALAKARWDMVRSVLLEKKSISNENGYGTIPPDLAASVRRFSSFDLFTVFAQPNTELVGTTKTEELTKWSRYSHKASTDVEIALLPQTFSSDELQGFNNTGNVCIWPSEEVMAYFCLENIEEFRGCSVCELGAGMTGLAGMLVAKTCLPKEVFVTDGNERSVSNLQSIIHRNMLSDVTAEVVVWKDIIVSSEYRHLKERFDVILCADCLFFTEVHKELIALLLYLTKLNSKVYVFSPERNGTMKQFSILAENHFIVEVSEKYLDIVSEKHESFKNNSCAYDPDIHYPKLMTMKKK